MPSSNAHTLDLSLSTNADTDATAQDNGSRSDAKRACGGNGGVVCAKTRGDVWTIGLVSDTHGLFDERLTHLFAGVITDLQTD